MKKLFALACITALVGSSMVGCGVRSTAEASQGTDSAEETTDSGEIEKGTEGDLVIYTALEDDIIEKYLESFREKYPDINLDIVRDSTGTIVAKAIAEKDNSVADVVWGTSASVLLQLDDYDLIKGYTPEGADRIMDEFKDTENEDMKWAGIDVYETAFLVNTDECERLGLEVPKSMEDLLDPSYKGLIVMPDPTSSGTGLLTVNGILQMMGEEEGWDYLEKLNDNILSYTTSGSKPAKMAASGECVIGLSMGYRCAQLYQEGNPVEVVFPSEGSGWDVEANCLINKEEINPCAYTFLDWAVSDEAMEAYSTEYPITSIGVINDIPEGYSEKPLENLCDLDLNQASEDREDILSKFETFLVGKTEFE
ncbi:MAG: extracellular solute-binding protein [Lachnospiraceae bacterium]|nr:extracellular solute-binding protein [Lachnospiraceae bacterium]